MWIAETWISQVFYINIPTRGEYLYRLRPYNTPTREECPHYFRNTPFCASTIFLLVLISGAINEYVTRGRQFLDPTVLFGLVKR